MKTVVIIPAHNEERTIQRVVGEAKRYATVVVIDDASKDRTAALAKEAGAHVIMHRVNRGLGGALRTGFAAALKEKPDIIITLDADGQHDPKDIPRFVAKINEGYDFVLGARDLRKYPLVKKVGNFFLNRLTNCVAGTSLRDTESGYRAFTATAVKKMRLSAERYEIAAEIVYEAGRNKFRAANIPIRSPVYVKGVTVTDGIKNFLFLLKK